MTNRRNDNQREADRDITTVLKDFEFPRGRGPARVKIEEGTVAIWPSQEGSVTPSFNEIDAAVKMRKEVRMELLYDEPYNGNPQWKILSMKILGKGTPEATETPQNEAMSSQLEGIDLLSHDQNIRWQVSFKAAIDTTLSIMQIKGEVFDMKMIAGTVGMYSDIYWKILQTGPMPEQEEAEEEGHPAIEEEV